MKSSCISHPANERLIIIRKWQEEFCDGNHCAAAVMTHFEYWHNWKLNSDKYHRKGNDVAEMHGDKRSLNEDVYQFHSMQEISDGILNLFGIKSIAEAIKLLESKKVITIHQNPNPNYFYDKKKYFRFYPEVCYTWLKDRDKSRLGKNAECNEPKKHLDSAKILNVIGKNAAVLGKNADAITEINNKDNNQSIQSDDNIDKFCPQPSNPMLSQLTVDDNHSSLDEVNIVINSLIERGFSAERLKYSDVIPELERLLQAGASINHFAKALQMAQQATGDKGFGVRYLVKVVEDLLVKKETKQLFAGHRSSLNKDKPIPPQNFSNEQNNLINAMSWAGDIIQELKQEEG